MCYEALRNGDATEKPLGAIVRAELRDALTTGLAAALIVASVLFSGSTELASLVPLALAALGLGAVLHQSLLVAGVAVQARRNGRGTRRLTDRDSDCSPLSRAL
ncbi:hypothetical protein BRC64_11655 [Halobacteriales archaeon QH_10_67_22]|nr:MAG: hypothetical protein BRC64_11655 [Halobacteriales archaeon QH_10_67_22]